MNNKTKTVLGVGVLVVFLIAAYFFYNHLSDSYNNDQNDLSNADSSTTADGEQLQSAPDFTVYDEDGNEVRLSDFIGKPIVLNFWASWCSPCKAEMPYFNEVYSQVNGEVGFLMIDMVDGRRETEEKGKEYIKEQGFSFPVYYDSEQMAAYVYGVSSIPTTYFINSEGKVVTGHRGMMYKDDLLSAIEMIKD